MKNNELNKQTVSIIQGHHGKKSIVWLVTKHKFLKKLASLTHKSIKVRRQRKRCNEFEFSAH